MEPQPTEEDETERVRRLISDRFGGRVRDFRVLLRDGAMVLRGTVGSYHLKQLVQETVIAATAIPIASNDIEVD